MAGDPATHHPCRCCGAYVTGCGTRRLRRLRCTSRRTPPEAQARYKLSTKQRPFSSSTKQLPFSSSFSSSTNGPLANPRMALGRHNRHARRPWHQFNAAAGPCRRSDRRHGHWRASGGSPQASTLTGRLALTEPDIATDSVARRRGPARAPGPRRARAAGAGPCRARAGPGPGSDRRHHILLSVSESPPAGWHGRPRRPPAGFRRLRSGTGGPGQA